LAGVGRVEIFRLVASRGAAEMETAPPASPCSTVTFPDGDFISFGRHCYRQPDGTVYLDVAANALVYTLRILVDCTEISRVSTWADAAFSDLEPDDNNSPAISVEPQRIALVSKRIMPTKRFGKDVVEEDSSAQPDQLILATRIVVARGEAERRLGTPVRRDFVMPLRGYNNITTGSVSYDEWRGMGCMMLYSGYGEMESLGVAVFKV
jgi:hypothetical protein